MGRLWAYSGLVLSKVSVTSARQFGPRDSEPLKMTSSMALPRRCLALCSPSTQRIESTMFDLPQPLGPTMPTTSWSKWITVRSTKDLKPVISNFFMCIDKLPSADSHRLYSRPRPVELRCPQTVHRLVARLVWSRRVAWIYAAERMRTRPICSRLLLSVRPRVWPARPIGVPRIGSAAGQALPNGSRVRLAGARPKGNTKEVRSILGCSEPENEGHR